MNPDLPFTAEYAKSNRASCKGCKDKIEKDALRMGIMVQSPHFDGKVPLWHHSKCFFEKKKIAVSNTSEIANFDNLRWDDQKQIKEQIGKVAAGGSGKKKGKLANSDFSVEYAKSGRAACRTCSEKILKGEIRISKLITNTPEAHKYGPMPGWRHVDCFVKSRMELEFTDSANKIPGFGSLSKEDQKMLSDKLGELKQLTEKRKADEPPPTPSKKLKKEDKLLKTQNDLLFNMRDKIEKNLSKKEIIMLLEHNNQHISAGISRLCDNLADCLVFGAIKVCPDCKNARPRFKIDSYRCSGNVTEWTRCQFVTKCPEREPFQIPEDFKEKYDFLKNYKYVKRDRLFPEKEENSVEEKKGPLSNYIVAIFGKFRGGKGPVEKKVMELGGAVGKKVNSSVQFCISTENDVAKDDSNVKLARSLDIHIVSPKVLEDLKTGSTPAVSIKDNLLCSWGEDPILKFGIKQEFTKSQAVVLSSSSSSSKSVSQKIKVTGGAAVDPESGKEDTCEVYQTKNNIYNVVLGVVDLARGINSYYKLQILAEKKSKKLYVFRAWGRVGTKIGSNKLESFKKASEAVEEFERLYLEKTGNEWQNRKNFVKKPGSFYPLDIDYGQESAEIKELKASSDCKLPMPVQELICLIFDIEAMKKAMIEFEIDLRKMPLGKLSKKQIELAYKVLNEAQQIIVTGCNSTKVLDASNRFYTLIPHDFGLKQPTMLDNEELIKSKIEMLDSLLEIEFAYNMMKNDADVKDPVSVHYEQLQTDIEVLDNSSDEFKTIKMYVKNTHAETHRQYDLVLNRVFKINRRGENERYQKFKSLHNKKLLWHGSRLTNYVGILSQGLRIAPPEAPVTGYMFGKGIYFADMVSKSANYCFTNKRNPTGILLLCEVALGNMYEKVNAEYVEKLPPNKHSTKGVGMTIPDPKEKTFIGDVEVPYGKPVQNGVGHSSLLYNEYIVYDVNQVNIKYLLDVTFKWKH